MDPFYGLFYYSYLPGCVREDKHFFLNPFDLLSYTEYNDFFDTRTFKTKSTQTDPVQSMLLGEKIIAAYGENYKLLLE